MFALSLVRVHSLFFLGVVVPISCSWWDQPEQNAKIFGDYEFPKIEDYPFMVSIVLTSPDNVPDQFICGGVNFYKTYDKQGIVLTSGSCINNLIKSKVNRAFVRVRSNSEYWDCGCGITREYTIRNWNIHPHYEEHIIPFVGTFIENDIGLIQIAGIFNGEYDYESSIAIDIRAKSFDYVSILGWGYTKSSDTVSKRLRVSKDLLIIPGKECKAKYYKNYFPKHASCLISTGGFEGPCAYDQGGPVFGRYLNQNYLLGIISTSPGCQNSLPAIVFTTDNYYFPYLTNLSWVIPSESLKKQNQYLSPKKSGGFQWWKPVVEI